MRSRATRRRSYGLTLSTLATAGVALAGASSSSAAARTDGSSAASAAVVTAIGSVPQAAFDAVGPGPLTRKDVMVKRLAGDPRPTGTVNVRSMNAAWCPHCAANSWPLAVALSRFGTLSGVRQLDTGRFYGRLARTRRYDRLQGLSFFGATIASPVVRFTPIVLQDLRGRNLQRPSRADQRLLSTFDGRRQVPAVAVGDVYGFIGSGVSPGYLRGVSAARITASLAEPTSTLGRRLIGQANVLTAAICAGDGGRPTEVCATPGVTRAATLLPAP